MLRADWNKAWAAMCGRSDGARVPSPASRPVPQRGMSCPGLQLTRAARDQQPVPGQLNITAPGTDILAGMAAPVARPATG